MVRFLFSPWCCSHGVPGRLCWPWASNAGSDPGWHANCTPSAFLLTSSLSKYEPKYLGRIRKASPRGCLPKPPQWLQGSPAPIRPRQVAGTGQTTGNCGSSWKSWNQTYPHHKMCWLGAQGSSAVWDASWTGRTLQAKTYGEEKRSLGFGFETRLTWFSEVLQVRQLCFLLGGYWELSSSQNSRYLSGILKRGGLQAVSEVPKGFRYSWSLAPKSLWRSWKHGEGTQPVGLLSEGHNLLPCLSSTKIKANCRGNPFQSTQIYWEIQNCQQVLRGWTIWGDFTPTNHC